MSIINNKCFHIWKPHTWKKFICVNCGKIETLDQHTWIPSEGRYVA